MVSITTEQIFLRLTAEMLQTLRKVHPAETRTSCGVLKCMPESALHTQGSNN